MCDLVNKYYKSFKSFIFAVNKYYKSLKCFIFTFNKYYKSLKCFIFAIASNDEYIFFKLNGTNIICYSI